MEIFVFKDLLIIFALSIFILLVGHRLSIPPVVGFLLTGMLAGPHGLGLIEKIGDVDTLAQIGIVLLLFGIGMEFSVKKLLEIKRLLMIGGTLQVALTTLIGFAIGQLLGFTWQEALLIGFLLSMSSTAVVIRLLEQKGEISSPQGRTSVSILIFQDMVAIPMLLFIPMLTEEATALHESTAWFLAKGLMTLITVFWCAEKLVPKLLHVVARTRCRELFLLSVLTLCFSVAWLTSSLGLSLTIGAFLAGLIISESEYSNEAISDIFPFQALFVSFFFVSIGMLLDLNFVLHQPFSILLIAFAIILIKTICAGVATLILGMPIRTAILVGIALCQIGEFSFVLAETGTNFHLLSDHEYQLFLAASLLTISLSPLLINYSSKLAYLASLLPLPNKIRAGTYSQNQTQIKLENHIIIVGFGVGGKNLAKSSKMAKIPYVILEMNPDTVREQKKLGEPIFFGDATHPHILEHAQIHNAKAVAILVNDPIAAKHMVSNARKANSSVYIIVRTRYVQETKLMANLGADEAIPDEFGSSIEVFSRVLKQYHIPDDEIYSLIEGLCSEGYGLLRQQRQTNSHLSEIKLQLSDVEINAFRLKSSSSLVGKSIQESQFRQSYGASILLIKRNSETIPNPSSDTRLQENDVVVIVGKNNTLVKAMALLN